MKRILFILFVIIGVTDLYAQREVHDTLFTTTGATDTTIFRVWRRETPYFEVDVASMADNDSVIIGYSTDRTTCYAASTALKMKIAKADLRSYVKGAGGTATRYRIAVVGDDWASKYLAIRFKSAGGIRPSIHWNP
jgi:hypothetical protein